MRSCPREVGRPRDQGIQAFRPLASPFRSARTTPQALPRHRLQPRLGPGRSLETFARGLDSLHDHVHGPPSSGSAKIKAVGGRADGLGLARAVRASSALLGGWITYNHGPVKETPPIVLCNRDDIGSSCRSGHDKGAGGHSVTVYYYICTGGKVTRPRPPPAPYQASGGQSAPGVMSKPAISIPPISKA